MVNRLPQEEFREAPFDAAGFNLHFLPTAGRRPLIILVHGLGGDGYGTWGRLSEQLFSGAGMDGVDIGVFNYPSGLRHFRRTIDMPVNQLVTHLRLLTGEYSEVFLVGHSLGGIVVEAVAMKHLSWSSLQQLDMPAALAALVLIAAPRAGSMWAHTPIAKLVPQIAILKRNSRMGQNIEEFFSTHTERRNVARGAPRAIVLPAYAAVAGGDKLVKRFSATFSVPSHQRFDLNATHRSVVKPGTSDTALIDWLSRIVTERLQVRAQAARERQHAQLRVRRSMAESSRPIVARFVSDTSGLNWEELYTEALRSASTSAVSVYDYRDVSDAEVDVVLAVHDAELVLAESTAVREQVVGVRNDWDRRPSMVVGMCPVGVDYVAAQGVVERWLAPYPPSTSIYVRGAADSRGARRLLARVLALVVDRDPRRRVRQALEDARSGDARNTYDNPDIGGY